MTRNVRYIDYPVHYGKLRTDILNTIDQTLRQGDVMLRQQLSDFEDNFAKFQGAKFAVGVSNCTDAMHLSLRAAEIGQGDEVITVSHTMVATAAAIHHTGAQPVLIDIGDDHVMDITKIESAITNRTKAIMPVHLNGRTCNMTELMDIAERNSLTVIEDAAQSIGGSFNGQKAGSFGIAGCFSFYPAKVLGAFGDGGAVITNNQEFAERLKLLRNHGRLPNGDVSGWAFNCRLDNLHAAILDLKMKMLPGWIQRRREIAYEYNVGLSGLSELHLPPPPEENDVHYDIFQNYEIEAENRDALVAFMEQQGIETLITWGGRGVHQFENLGLGDHILPRTEEMFKKVIMIPMYPDLSDDDVRYVVETIRRFYGR